MSALTDSVRDLYASSFAKYGSSPMAVGWRDEESQRLRFDKLLSVTDGSKGAFELNELGVGYGALHDHLVSSGRKLAKFRGYDIVEEMIDAARSRLPSEAELFVGDRITQSAQFSVASGIFNVPGVPDEDRWADYIVDVLDNMNDQSTNGFAFNLLTSYVEWKAEGLYYADPARWFSLCKSRYGRFVALLHDYPLWEWTILVRK